MDESDKRSDKSKEEPDELADYSKPNSLFSNMNENR
jgi:hypothetical protein